MRPADAQTMYDAVVANSPLALAVTEGADYRFRSANDAFCRLTGRARERVLDHPFIDVFPSAGADGTLAFLDRVRHSGGGRLDEVEHRRPGRGVVYWSYTAWSALDEMADGLSALFIQISDVTERVRERADSAHSGERVREANERLLEAGLREQKLADEAGRHSEEMDALLESMGDGVTVIDAEGEVVLMNPEGRRIFRMPAGGASRAPETWTDTGFRRPDGKPLPVERWPLARALRGEHFEQEEFVVVRPDGSERRIAFSGSAIRDDDDRVALAIVAFRDVTELRDLEELKDQFHALISHDLRSPLNAILGFTGLLQTTLGERGLEREAGQAGRIADIGKRMNVMIGELLESTRLESGRMPIHKRPTDPRRLVSATIEHLDGAEARQRIQIEEPHPLPRVPADPSRIERALTNLLTNALKYSPAEAPVTIRIARRGDDLVVSVTDRGTGIPPEDVPHVFERFHRATRHDESDGLGLGLYITRLIIEAHGGNIRVDSREGEGSTFTFTLPIE